MYSTVFTVRMCMCHINYKTCFCQLGAYSIATTQRTVQHQLNYILLLTLPTNKSHAFSIQVSYWWQLILTRHLLMPKDKSQEHCDALMSFFFWGLIFCFLFEYLAVFFRYSHLFDLYCHKIIVCCIVFCMTKESLVTYSRMQKWGSSYTNFLY